MPVLGYTLPEPGVTPESPLYALDLLDEQMRLFFAFTSEGRFSRRIASVEERLAEADELAGRSVVATIKALEHYKSQLLGTELQAMASGNQVHLYEVAKLVVAHIAFLDQISEQTDLDQRRSVSLIKEYIVDDHEDALSALIKENSRLGLEVCKSVIENRFSRIREVAIDMENVVTEPLREYEKYIILATEIVNKAETAEERESFLAFFRTITSSHEAVLMGEVKEKIKPQAEERLKNAVNALRVLHGLPVIEIISETPVITEPPIETATSTPPNPVVTPPSTVKPPTGSSGTTPGSTGGSSTNGTTGTAAPPPPPPPSF